MVQIIENKKNSKLNFWINKKILITGGTAGLGRALALKLVKSGAEVAVVGRTKNKLDSLHTENPKIIIIQADISIKEDIHKVSGQSIGQLGKIDVLINNASHLGHTPLQSLIDTPCEDLVEVLETNLLGPFRLAKAILPTMIMNNYGLVINISSDAAVNAYETWGGYSISKAGLDHLTRIWNEELNHKGIQFISIDPGDMHTQMHLNAIPDADVTSLLDPADVANDLSLFLTHQNFSQVRFSANEWRQIF